MSRDEEEIAWGQFKSTIVRDENGRYVVASTWKSDVAQLSRNAVVAERRLQSITKRLKSEGLLHKYDEVF